MSGMRMSILIFALLSSATAFGNMRCEYGTVRRGLTPFEVLQRCGDAAFEQTRLELREPGYYVQVDEWVYQQGTNKFQRLLRFENGRLRKIELLDKPRGFSTLY